MKKFLLLLIMSPLYGLAQPINENITGAWEGFINTSQRRLPYEIVISDSSGTLTGFSKVVFKIKGEEYSIVKSLVITSESGKYVIQEDKVLFDNIQDDAPKKARQTSIVSLAGTDNAPVLSGTYKTKVDKGQRAPSGDINLHKTIPDSSKLLAELKQMDLSKDIAFQEPKKEPVKPVVKVPEPVIVEEEPTLALNSKRSSAEKLSPISKSTKQPTLANKKTTRLTLKRVPLIAAKAPTPVASEPDETDVAVLKDKKTTTSPVKATVQKPTEIKSAPINTPVAPVPPPKRVEPVYVLADIGNRRIETIQTVYFRTDSLKLTLYDNGEVDGDTVSVILNGRMIMNKKGLSTSPISETVYITPEMGDSMQMVMYAENLGTIPPNTGLLIVQDGRDRYEIRFSGDLNKNAAIIFKKRK